MLAFSNDYYGMIFRATQSVELFCAYFTFDINPDNCSIVLYICKCMVNEMDNCINLCGIFGC